MSQSHQRSTRFDLEMRLGESYIEGKALSDDGEYTINIQEARLTWFYQVNLKKSVKM
jgi:hypothetical protein